MQEFLASSTAPHYAGEFAYGDRAGHGWSPFEGHELLETLAAFMQAPAPGSRD